MLAAAIATLSALTGLGSLKDVLASRLVQAALIAALAGGFGFVKGVNFAHVDVPALRQSIEDGCNARWQGKLIEQERIANEELQRAIEARHEAVPVPTDPAGLRELCRKSPTCRDQHR